jgi:acid phosphatase type 7
MGRVAARAARTSTVIAGLLALSVAGGPSAQAAQVELLPNGGFGTGSGSLSGWVGFNSVLSSIPIGVDATPAARIANKKAFANIGIDAAPAPVGSTTAGVVYTTEAWLRGPVAGESVCLRLTELNSTGAQAAMKQRCVALTTAWTPVTPLSYTTLTNGGTLDLRVFMRNAVASHSFDVDNVSLTAPSADAGSPTAPQDLAATYISDTKVGLSWSPSSDEVGVTGYQIARDGAPLTSVPAAQTTFVDSGLTPATEHSYTVTASDQAGYASAPSAAVTVTTLAAPPAAPVIAAAGDVACDPQNAAFNGGLGSAVECRQAATAAVIQGINPAAVLLLGDGQYQCGAAAAWTQSFDASWGAFKGLIRPAVGNHDYYKSGSTGCDTTGRAAGYYGYFGAAAGPPDKGYYSYDLGAWHLISLNSQCAKACAATAKADQIAWLMADMAAHPTQCTLAYFHHPRFSSGGHGNDGTIGPLWDALQAGGTDVVLNGHEHSYERFLPQLPSGVASPSGISEIIVGTGGRNHTLFPTNQPNSAIKDGYTFGALKMTLEDGSFSWEFVPEPGSTFGDAGSTACH